MSVILQSWFQIKPTFPGLRYLNCGPGHIPCNYSSAYLGFNIQLNLPALILEICRQFNATYTGIIVPNTAHTLYITLCELWPLPYTMYLQLRIFRPEYLTERICAAIGDITNMQCASYCKLGAKYSAHPPVYAMWTVVPAIYNKMITPHIESSIFNCAYLSCYWRYLDNSRSAILHTWYQIQRTSFSLGCVKLSSRPYTMQIQLCIFRLQYSTKHFCAAVGDIATIQWALYCNRGAKYSARSPVYAIWTVVPDIYNVITAPHINASIFNCRYLRCYCRYLINSMRVILQTWRQIQRTSSSLLYVNFGPGHIKCNYSSAYSGFNIQLNLPALLLEICRQFNAPYTANLVPNTAHILRFTLCELVVPAI
jgi:hypothetical protein